MTDEQTRRLIRKLKTKPGRGGVRLSHEEAQLALVLIETGARALIREKRRNGVSAF